MYMPSIAIASSCDGLTANCIKQPRVIRPLTPLLPLLPSLIPVQQHCSGDEAQLR